MNQLGLNWEFVEQHYPDYQRSDVICLSNDMAACFEFAELDADALVTEDTVATLKAQASYSEPSVYQVCEFDDYVGSGMTFGQAAQETDDYCLAVAIHHCTAPLPEQYRLWADNVLG